MWSWDWSFDRIAESLDQPVVEVRVALGGARFSDPNPKKVNLNAYPEDGNFFRGLRLPHETSYQQTMHRVACYVQVGIAAGVAMPTLSWNLDDGDGVT